MAAGIGLRVSGVLLSVVFMGAMGQEYSFICQGSEIDMFPLYTSSIIYLRSPAATENITTECRLSIPGSIGVRGKIKRLEITSFDLNGRDPCSSTEEYLQINFPTSQRGEVDSIRWCGKSYSQYFETREAMEIVYNPGSDSTRGPGFFMNVRIVSSFQCGTDDISVGEQPIYIYSPGYPGSYDGNMDSCTWNVVSKGNNPLLLDTLRFFVESHAFCRYDRLQVDGRDYCGDQRVQLVSRSNSLQLKFVTDFDNTEDGFILKIVENTTEPLTCGGNVTAKSTPIVLHIPDNEQIVTDSNCNWLVDAGSDDAVVLLEMHQYISYLACSDLDVIFYDGQNILAPRILFSCSPLPLVQTIRTSFRYLYIDASVGRFSKLTLSFTVISSPRYTAPRVLYADYAESLVWVDLERDLDLGLLIRGREESMMNYTACIELYMKRAPIVSEKLNTADYIYAFSGWNGKFADLTKPCQLTEPQKRILSRGSKIFIKKRNNPLYSRQRVWLLYRLLRYCQPEAIPLRSSSSVTRTIQSSNAVTFEDDKEITLPFYTNNVYCAWIIMPENDAYFAQVSVLQSSLYSGSPGDNMTAYDLAQFDSNDMTLLMSWGATATPKILSSRGNYIQLEFITNADNVDKGFTLEYSSVVLPDQCPSLGKFNADGEIRTLTSPNYPYNYPNNIDCKWRITAISGVVELTLESLDIDYVSSQCSRHDYLIIYDGMYTSDAIVADKCVSSVNRTKYVSSKGSFLLHFHSDASGTASGFRLSYRKSDEPKYWHCTGNLFLTVSSDKEIKSPFYPSTYPGSTNCYWHVQALLTHIVMLKVLDIQVPCNTPVRLYDGSSSSGILIAELCAESYTRRYMSTQKSMFVTFRAAGITGSGGFHFQLRSWESNRPCEGNVVQLMAYNNKRYITSPLYPAYYPAYSTCKWRIETAIRNMTVRVRIEDAHIESSLSFCNFDSLSFYDGYGVGSPLLGKFCGETSGKTYWSHETYMFLYFVSDGHRQFRGFRLSYWAEEGQPPSVLPSDSSDDSGTTGKIVGGVLSGLFILIISITGFLCFTGRCKRQQQTPSSPRNSSGRERGNTVVLMSPVFVSQTSLPSYPAPRYPEDSPPEYNVIGSNSSLPVAPPPEYMNMDAPPPYSEAMIESHPPSSPMPSHQRLNENSGPEYDSPIPEDGNLPQNHDGSSDHSYDTLLPPVSSAATDNSRVMESRTPSSLTSPVSATAAPLWPLYWLPEGSEQSTNIGNRHLLDAADPGLTGSNRNDTRDAGHLRNESGGIDRDSANNSRPTDRGTASQNSSERPLPPHYYDDRGRNNDFTHATERERTANRRDGSHDRNILRNSPRESADPDRYDNRNVPQNDQRETSNHDRSRNPNVTLWHQESRESMETTFV